MVRLYKTPCFVRTTPCTMISKNRYKTAQVESVKIKSLYTTELNVEMNKDD